MGRISYFQDMLTNILGRGFNFRLENDERDIHSLCEAILSEKGEVSGGKLAIAILTKYRTLDLKAKAGFFLRLANEFDLDPAAIIEAAKLYEKTGEPKALKSLTELSEPRRRELLRRINQAPGATGELVNMRRDLIEIIPENFDLNRLDADFEHLFSSWFNRGFLVLRPIDWKTPANILEKIIEYEAVHAITDWEDLRQRLEPADRYCFAFFHPAMPEEPLIFVEVALSNGIPASVDNLLGGSRNQSDPGKFDTAVFYSISNCQKGLKGISFGSFLIKQVVADLALQFPNLKNFVTLSPVPGFRKWLAEMSASDRNKPAFEISTMLEKAKSKADIRGLAELEKPLTALLAKYLLEAKRPDGKPTDPVSRFHLGNGASLVRLNWMADTSPNGFNQSASMMVNYKYDLATLEDNHEAYSRENSISTTREIRSVAKSQLKI